MHLPHHNPDHGNLVVGCEKAIDDEIKNIFGRGNYFSDIDLPEIFFGERGRIVLYWCGS
jgi:hypothetical protein